MKILIVGGAGFLGHHIANAAFNAGHDYATIDLKLEASIVGHSAKADADTIQHYDRVIDVSGRLGTSELFADIIGAAQANIVNTLKILQACEEAGVHYTYVTLGNKWLNPYSITKNCAADFVRMYDQVLKLPTQVAITYNCYGPRQRWEHVRKIIPHFMTSAIRSRRIEVFGDGRQCVDLVFVRDFAKSLVESVVAGERGTIHYGTANPMSVNDVARLCAGALKMDETEIVHVAARAGETGGGSVCSDYPMKHVTDPFIAMLETANWYKENFKP